MAGLAGLKDIFGFLVNAWVYVIAMLATLALIDRLQASGLASWVAATIAISPWVIEIIKTVIKIRETVQEIKKRVKGVQWQD
jgi:hypothetical protein